MAMIVHPAYPNPGTVKGIKAIKMRAGPTITSESWETARREVQGIGKPVREDQRPNTQSKHVCPVECAAKLLLLLGLSTILLFVPLGRFTHCEPSCNPKSKLAIWDDNTSAMCCLCDLYKTTLYLGQAFKEVFDRSLAFVWNSFYEAKIQFYRILGSLDNYDLCRSVCCDERELRVCRCPRHSTCNCKY